MYIEHLIFSTAVHWIKTIDQKH